MQQIAKFPEHSPVELCEHEICTQLFNIIGEGSDSIVYSGIIGNTKCAIKFVPLISKLSCKHYSESKENLYSESNTLSNISHPHIVTLIKTASKGALTNPCGIPFEAHYTALEILEGGSLLKFAEIKPLSEQELLFYISPIIDAIFALHSKGFCHRDIKGENILLNSDLSKAKLADFGFAISSENFSKAQIRGTYEYLAPELHFGLKDNIQKSDVFALGVTIFSLLSGRFPCSKSCTQSDPIYKLICERKFSEFWQKTVGDREVSQDFKELIQDMLNPSIYRRPSIEKLKEYSWFRKSNPGNIAEIIKGMQERLLRSQ